MYFYFPQSQRQETGSFICQSPWQKASSIIIILHFYYSVYILSSNLSSAQTFTHVQVLYVSKNDLVIFRGGEREGNAGNFTHNSLYLQGILNSLLEKRNNISKCQQRDKFHLYACQGRHLTLFIGVIQSVLAPCCSLLGLNYVANSNR